MREKATKLFAALDFFQAGEVTTDRIKFAQEVRVLCENNVCRKYGTTWACPPAVGTVEECAAKLRGYKYAAVFSGKYDLEDSFDFEGMQAGHEAFEKSGKALAKAAREAYGDDWFLLSSEGCGECAECTYPGAPCRFPEEMHPSVEGFGIYVNELTKAAGINYINGANTVTYIGALFYND